MKDFLDLLKEIMSESKPPVPLYKIPLKYYSWFDGKEPLLSGIGNKAEAWQRLQWLSEGSLYYHLKHAPYKFGGDPRELELYKQFREYLAGAGL